MPQTISCPLCRSTGSRLVRIDCGAKIVRCTGCDFVYVNPQPTAQELSLIYSQEYYPMTSQDVGQALRSRLPVFQNSIQKLGKLAKPGRLLDQGCGTGDFVELAQQAGWDAQGIDLSESAVRFAASKGLKVELGTLESNQYPTESFDVVTLWDVLEHLPNPRHEIEQIHRVLRVGGLLVIRVPNTNFQLLKAFVREDLFKAPHDSLQANFHVNHFSPKTLRNLLEMQGFEVFEEEAGVSEDVVHREHIPLKFKKIYCGFARALQSITSLQVGPTMVFYGRKIPSR